MVLKKTSLLLFLIFFIAVVPVLATTVEEQQQKIDEYEAKVATLQTQSKTLVGQIETYNGQISLSELKISQTEDMIASVSGRINKLENELRDRSVLLEKQIVQSYKRGKIDPIQMLFGSSGVANLMANFKYLQVVQSQNSKFLYSSQKVQANYIQQKDLIEESKKKLQAQKVILNNLRVERNSLLQQTKNSEANYQNLLAQARIELAAIQSYVAGEGGASILNNQTFCNDWGCYYNQRDSQWGSVRLGNSNLSTAEYGCLVSSVAMMVTHYGKSLKPINIAVTNSAFYSPNRDTAMLWDSISVNGINLTRIRYGQNLGVLNNELAAGKSVIVGLFSGPGHFIVIKSKQGNDYIMNDPFMENGHDRKFSEKYKISDITDVEKIVFN